jgi:threonylcarbamoyladenosine tRNA methylthiotransferase MtaB
LIPAQLAGREILHFEAISIKKLQKDAFRNQACDAITIYCLFLQDMKTVAFYTLGCKLNFSETSAISRMFETEGFRKVNFEEGADIYVINTCSVTDNADKKCRKVVKEARKYSQDPYIILMGCYAQLKPDEIAGIPGVDTVLGAAEKFKLFEHIKEFKKPDQPIVAASPISEANSYHQAFSISDRTRTFLKIQDGCDYSCAFCTIPLARGKSRSDTMTNIIASANEIAKRGVKEIVLTGVNTGDYGIVHGKREVRFIDLIQALDKIEGVERFRISSIEPNLLTDEIIEFVANSHQFVPHFHIPLQSGSNKILKRMRRRYLRELYADRILKIKSIMPNACIGVDVIVGFPGETEQDFLAGYEFINELDVSYLHVFTYSERANTLAIDMEGTIPVKVRSDRSRMLRNLSFKKRRKFYEDNIGKEEIVLFENDIENGRMHGFTRNYIRVSAKYDPVLINETLRVKLKEINEAGLVEVEDIPDRQPVMN